MIISIQKCLKFNLIHFEIKVNSLNLFINDNKCGIYRFITSKFVSTLEFNKNEIYKVWQLKDKDLCLVPQVVTYTNVIKIS